MFELEEHKVEPMLVKLRNTCFHKKVPIIVGQKGNCYKILRHFDQGSFGMMFYGAKIDSNFEIQRDIAETDFVVIKIFDVRNKSYLEQYLNELDTLLCI